MNLWLFYAILVGDRNPAAVGLEWRGEKRKSKTSDFLKNTKYITSWRLKFGGLLFLSQIL